jgi:uncharacterized protein (DUF1015 family)
VIRLILGRKTPDDTPENNAHTRSADYFRRWMERGILIQDALPALYLKAITYDHGQQTITRYGLIAMVGLEDFEKRIILPHEKTFSKVRSERLDLMKATHCNFCPIFSLYPDDGGILSVLQGAVDPSAPMVDFMDDHAHRHRLWAIVDGAVHQQVTTAMADKRLYIADGHHRYETALNFRNYLKTTDPHFNDRHPANFVMMYLCSMRDPGLIILPAHRLIKDISGDELKRAVESARDDFDVTPFPFTDDNRPSVEQAFLSALKTAGQTPCIGIYGRRQSTFYRLRLNPGTMDRLFADELDPALRALDVSVLTRLLFMRILGFDQARLDNEQLIGYASVTSDALAAIDKGDFDAAFLLNPTRMEQVQEVAQKGLIMPRKSTYFYPKVKSGLVMHTLR